VYACRVPLTGYKLMSVIIFAFTFRDLIGFLIVVSSKVDKIEILNKIGAG
jgi:hypothetical protein